jgi:hypothetical protein
LDRAPARRRRACGDALSAKQELILDSVLTVQDQPGRCRPRTSRLQLWACAPVDPTYARINHQALVSYRDRPADLIRGARPELTCAAAARRAGDIVVIQNGIRLTSLLITDREATDRAVRRCEQIALDPDH